MPEVKEKVKQTEGLLAVAGRALEELQRIVSGAGEYSSGCRGCPGGGQGNRHGPDCPGAGRPRVVGTGVELARRALILAIERSRTGREPSPPDNWFTNARKYATDPRTGRSQLVAYGLPPGIGKLPPGERVHPEDTQELLVQACQRAQAEFTAMAERTGDYASKDTVVSPRVPDILLALKEALG